MRAARWGDGDHYFGPFTWSYSDAYKHWAVEITSRGDDDDTYNPCRLRVTLWKATLIVALPDIIRPWRQKVYPRWDDATVKRLGRNWYWDVHPREYGISYSNGFLQVHYGRRTHDSSNDQTWSRHLPWTQWRHVRRSFYGLQGEHLYDEPQTFTRLGDDWEARKALEEAIPTAAFAFKDFDGQELIATTRIEEREWRFGTGWFKWLSLFRRPKVRRSLHIEFSDETGPEKGSWKGGTIGTGIDMLPGELHEAAFRRYCDQDHRSKYRPYRVAFVGAVALDKTRT